MKFLANYRIGEVLEFFKEKTRPSQDSFMFEDNLDDGILFKIENLTYSAPQSIDKPLAKGSYH
jgi:hypothetical protein